MNTTFIKTNPEGKNYRPSRRTVEIVGHELLTQDIVRLTISDEYTAQQGQAGQFVNLYSKNPLQMSPRPFGISEIHGDKVSFIFAVVGRGTAEFRDMSVGDRIDILGPLGKPFDVSKTGRYLLVAGGLGIPPILHAAQKLSQRDDAQVTTMFGYRNEHFADSYVDQYCDDTRSIDNAQGNVIDLLNTWIQENDVKDLKSRAEDIHILTCGPEPMMKAVAAWACEHNIDTQLSLEERMGCGYGTCVVCITPTIHGNQKVCIEGPVFTREELGWK
ncbi:dihydroorotate dehydrogenase electron transfer subunit [Alloscardovia theropitheci]|uniref:Dihydroorotate dehydrogenase electron transfer subunit n=2 Tax=Alloscardovia theropitheci TaxID=2496842 RepID=A0A4R0QR88_9BIFI|nr:dihydroorotate dehydrogenase electron transfer subunit [Alloscardovia theropitheci]